MSECYGERLCPILDGVSYEASGAGGADVQRTVDSPQKAVDTMQGKVDSVLPQLKEIVGQLEPFQQSSKARCRT